MKYPNKLASFRESTFQYFVPYLKELTRPISPITLYKKVDADKRPEFSEYIDVLTCLFILGKIELDEELGVIRRVD